MQGASGEDALVAGRTALLKPCRKCGEIKPLSDFYLNKSCRQGVTGTCRTCTQVRLKRWYTDNRKRRQEKANDRNQKRKQELVGQFGNKCHDCKQVYPLCVYDFHHLDPTKKDVNPSYAIALSDDRRRKELAKCIMLCANCHRIRHFGRKEGI